MEVRCDLCEKIATMRCDSGQAKLCWECDEKVHSANSVVEKHTRVLLCCLCLSPTPWKASGPKLAPTVTFCHQCCVANLQANSQHQHVKKDDDDRRDDMDDAGKYSYDADSDSDHVFDGEEGEGENQVVASNASACASCYAASCASTRSQDDSSDVHETRFSSTTLPSSYESTSARVFRPSRERRSN